MIGAGRDMKEDSIDPAVGVILEVKVGQKNRRQRRALPAVLHGRRTRGGRGAASGRRLRYFGDGSERSES